MPIKAPGANDSEIIEEFYYYDRIWKHSRDHGTPIWVFFVYSPNLLRAVFFETWGDGGALVLKPKINLIELIIPNCNFLVALIAHSLPFAFRWL